LKENIMRIAIVGAGYVGLVSGACLADFGHNVTIADKDTSRVAALTAGKMPIYEPGLDVLVERNVAQGRLSFTKNLVTAAKDAEAIFIAVGTPARRGDSLADLSYVYQAAREVAPLIKKFTVIITKSTVPVGTSDEVERIIHELRPDADFAVVSNPEFLREGAAIDDFKRPDRIIIGTNSERAGKVMAEIYSPLYLNKQPIISVSPRSAELTKYAANAFLATKITFINEIADLCEQVGADVQDVARGMGLDNRIGSKFLHAGPGYGGSCFPKDTLALIQTAQAYQAPMRIVEAVATINEQRKRAMGRKVIAACGGTVRNAQIAVLGLTFKPKTDDMRESPSLTIIRTLQDAGARITAYDPQGMEQAKSMLENVRYATDPYACANGAQALVIITEWDEFRALDLGRIRANMRNPVLVDLRNIYRPEELERHGFTYVGVGRATHPTELVAQIAAAVAA
jgi:UDPglucose 6-dehydrogenase